MSVLLVCVADLSACDSTFCVSEDSEEILLWNLTFIEQERLTLNIVELVQYISIKYLRRYVVEIQALMFSRTVVYLDRVCVAISRFQYLGLSESSHKITEALSRFHLSENCLDDLCWNIHSIAVNNECISVVVKTHTSAFENRDYRLGACHFAE